MICPARVQKRCKFNPESCLTHLKPTAFQWLDIDMYSGQPLPRNPCATRSVPGSRRKPVPVIRMYGVTEKGNSVMAHIHGFTPYFVCNTPPGFVEADLGKFRSALEHRLKSDVRMGREPVQEIVLSVQLLSNKQSLLGYHFNKTTSFLKVP